MAKFLKDIVKDVTADKEIKSFNLTQNEVEAVLRKALTRMGDVLADGEKLYLIGFINFEPKDYRAKNSKHPQTQEPIVIEPYRGILSKPSDSLKEKLEAGRLRSPIK
ncbi:HU family DNA-binding protein [Brevibacillus laterosporus]|uniref:HU family DNA-binding protein n=1 Tax=Brevibacillus laterosporus TaxID=1465 RepID=UPI003D228B46